MNIADYSESKAAVKVVGYVRCSITTVGGKYIELTLYVIHILLYIIYFIRTIVGDR